MRGTYQRRALVLLTTVAMLPVAATGQGQSEDYARSESLNTRLQGTVINAAEAPTWIAGSNRFYYRKSVSGGNEFVLVDAATQQKRPAFDHARVATALSAVAGATYAALTLPFNNFTYADNERAIEFTADGSRFRCELSEAKCTRLGPAPQGGFGNQGPRTTDEPVRSPDGKLEAVIRNYNVAVRPAGSRSVAEIISTDGSEGNAYSWPTLRWSPDSKKIAAYRITPGYRREVHYVESSPEDQLQPKHSTRVYAKPGDVLDVEMPVIFDVASKAQLNVDNALFPNAYDVSNLVWRNDSRAVTFEYNQRGHEIYRVIEVDAKTGSARAVISDEPKTFFYYRPASGGLTDSGKLFRHDLNDGREAIWMSERDGWSHLYMYDGLTGKVKHQITKGEWVVRNVERVDEANKQIYFRASGMNAGQDPYFLHNYRINFDGTGLVAYTEGNSNHNVSWSPDRQYYTDLYSRVDMPPVLELRRASDRKVVMEVEKADASALLKTGWTYPEVFVSKARDGKTDIWGVIIKPTNFDPSKKYAVIENIYAGPQGSFVPKTFSNQAGMQALAELGFIVVQVDGMGTNNRSKAFHDVAWKNLGDAGFPDRIIWHKAIAAKYPWYDVSRVGIYGTSAGGQNSLGGLLFHPDFYKVAVSAVGCHDNRMDKIWWNELWMSWPIGPQYSASSNVDNAYRLQGKVLLVVGELDTNVDPSSTLQVANALIKSNKDFDLLFVPGAGHGPGGAYGLRRRNDFFVENLLGVKAPDRNMVMKAANN